MSVIVGAVQRFTPCPGVAGCAVPSRWFVRRGVNAASPWPSSPWNWVEPLLIAEPLAGVSLLGKFGQFERAGSRPLVADGIAGELVAHETAAVVAHEGEGLDGGRPFAGIDETLVEHGNIVIPLTIDWMAAVASGIRVTGSPPRARPRGR